MSDHTVASHWKQQLTFILFAFWSWWVKTRTVHLKANLLHRFCCCLLQLTKIYVKRHFQCLLIYSLVYQQTNAIFWRNEVQNFIDKVMKFQRWGIKINNSTLIQTKLREHQHPPGTLQQRLTLNVLYHTIPHKLCRCEMKDVHSLQSFISTHSEESDSLLFVLCLHLQILVTSAILKENSAISLEERVLVFTVFTIATRKLKS